MDSLQALGDPACLRIVECLLDLDEGNGPRQLTHAELTTALGSLPGTLTKRLHKLRAAGLVVTSPGPRKDQPHFGLRQSGKLLALLLCAAELDAAISDEQALLQRIDADIKADYLHRLTARSARET